jgi:hypothetical protein
MIKGIVLGMDSLKMELLEWYHMLCCVEKCKNKSCVCVCVCV